ncbi:MAG: hypothetical protein ABIA97_05140 [Candidatus Omnitrophota bacterium]
MNHPGIAAVLSFVFSGLGQLYNGQIFKGLVTIFLAAASLLLTVLSAVLIYSWVLHQEILSLLWYGVALFIISIIAICIIAIYSILDAYKQAQRQ